jgi:hypothetical protein
VRFDKIIPYVRITQFIQQSQVMAKNCSLGEEGVRKRSNTNQKSSQQVVEELLFSK